VNKFEWRFDLTSLECGLASLGRISLKNAISGVPVNNFPPYIVVFDFTESVPERLIGASCT
jgi:hypothetical protein